MAQLDTIHFPLQHFQITQELDSSILVSSNSAEEVKDEHDRLVQLVAGTPCCYSVYYVALTIDCPVIMFQSDVALC